MAYNENKAFIPQSPAQLKKEYLETPFWFARFGPGSQITIVEDHPKNKPLRFIMKPSNKGGPAFATNLIKISDGFVQKDLELSKTSAQLLFYGLPDEVQNLKGCTFANDNGRWIFVAQTTPGHDENFPKSNQVAASMTEAPTEIGRQVQALVQGMEMTANLGIELNSKTMITIAEGMYVLYYYIIMGILPLASASPLATILNPSYTGRTSNPQPPPLGAFLSHPPYNPPLKK